MKLTLSLENLLKTSAEPQMTIPKLIRAAKMTAKTSSAPQMHLKIMWKRADPRETPPATIRKLAAPFLHDSGLLFFRKNRYNSIIVQC